MSYIDIILCVPIVWGIYKGFTKGLITEIATFIAFGLGIWGAINFSDFIANQMKTSFAWNSPYLPLIAFALTFLGIAILVYFAAKLIQGMVEGMALGAFNRIGGALFGALKFALVMSVVIFMLDAVSQSYPVVPVKVKEQSLLYKPIGSIAPLLIPSLNKSRVAALKPAIDSISAKVR